MLTTRFASRSFRRTVTSIEAAMGRPGLATGTRRRRRRSVAGIEQLEVRQLLTGDFEWAKRVGGMNSDSGTNIAIDDTRKNGTSRARPAVVVVLPRCRLLNS